MQRQRITAMIRIQLYALLVIALLGQAPVRGENHPLAMIPESAEIIIRLSSPAQTVQKIADLAGQVTPELAAVVTANAGLLGPAILNPTLAGVDQQRDWHAALFTQPNSPPAVVFVIPSMDTPAMLAALPQQAVVHVSQDWVIYSLDQSAAERFAAEQAADAKAIENVMGELTRAKFDAGDLSVFVNIGLLSSRHGAWLAGAQRAATMVLSDIQRVTQRSIDPEAGFLLDSQLIDAVFQGIDDLSAVCLAVSIDQSGLLLDSHVEVTAGSEVSRWFAAQPVSGFESLAKLPSDAEVYFGFSGDFAGFAQVAIPYLEMGGASATEKFRELLQEELQTLEYGPRVSSFAIREAGHGATESVRIVKAAPTERARELNRQSIEWIGQVGAEHEGFSQSATILSEAESYGRHQADVMTIERTLAREAAAENPLARWLRVFADTGDEQRRFVYLDDVFIETRGGGTELMEQTLKRFDRTADGNDRDLLRADLLQPSNLLLLADVSAIGIQVLSAAGEQPGQPQADPADPTRVDQPRPTRSYLACSLVVEAAGLRARIKLPAEQLQQGIPLLNRLRP